MAPMTEVALARRGRLAYELGRARWASQVLLIVLPLLLVARLIGHSTELVVGLGGALAFLALALAMLHDRYARAVHVGVIAGLPGLVLPLLLRSLGFIQLGSKAIDPCILASFVSGVAAGVFVSGRAVDERHHLTFWLAAVVVAALTGTLGCSVAGSAGVVGLMAGVLAGTAPVVIGAGLRRR